MILDAESWMNIRRFRALHEAGAPEAAATPGTLTDHGDQLLAGVGVNAGRPQQL